MVVKRKCPKGTNLRIFVGDKGRVGRINNLGCYQNDMHSVNEGNTDRTHSTLSSLLLALQTKNGENRSATIRVCHSVRLEFGELEGPEIVATVARSMLSGPCEMSKHHKTHCKHMSILLPRNNSCTYTGDALKTRTQSVGVAHLLPQPEKYLLKCLVHPQLR